MSKLIGAIITAMILNVAVFLFANTDTGLNPDTGEAFIAFNQNNTVWDYLANPNTGENSPFWMRLFGLSAGLLAIGAVTIFVGLFVTRDVNVWYIGLAVTLAMFLISPWISLYGFVNNMNFPFGGKSGGTIAFLLIGGIIIVQIINIIDWARGQIH